MNKADLLCRVAIIALLVLIAYQQIAIKNEIASIPRSEGISSYDVLRVQVVNKKEEKIPVEIVAPVQGTGPFGLESVRVSPQ